MRRKPVTQNPGDLVEAARRVVAEHGWDAATRSLAQSARAVSHGLPPDRGDSILAPVFEVATKVGQSAWTPVLAPLVAAGLTSINQPHIETAGAADDPLERSLEIPIPRASAGPMTRARQRRLTASFATAQLAGLAAVLFEAGPAREAWATGVMFPGAGFVYTRDPARFAITAAAFGLAGVLWFGTGNHIAAAARVGGSPPRSPPGAPPAGPSAGAALPYVVATVSASWPTSSSANGVAASSRKQKQAIAANALLKDGRPAAARGRPARDPHRSKRWTTDDRAVAPFRRHGPSADGRLARLGRLDQFQTAAIRYQVDHLIYTLALQKYTRTPAFRGYHDEAMRRLVRSTSRSGSGRTGPTRICGATSSGTRTRPASRTSC